MAVTLPTVVPAGGRGQSARCSRVFFLAPNCDSLVLDGTEPTGLLSYFSEQVVRIAVNQQISSREYAHDKSFCAQDSTPGIMSWNGEITTRVQCNTTPFSFRAGLIMWLDVWPLGVARADARIAGYAMLKTDPIVMNIENGDPVEHNYSYTSKGWWKIPTGVSGTFDCCNCCAATPSSASSEAEPETSFQGGFATELAAATHSTPYTVYQWDDPERTWVVVMDECREGWLRGPAPSGPPAFPAQASFNPIPCVRFQ